MDLEDGVVSHPHSTIKVGDFRIVDDISGGKRRYARSVLHLWRLFVASPAVVASRGIHSNGSDFICGLKRNLCQQQASGTAILGHDSSITRLSPIKLGCLLFDCIGNLYAKADLPAAVESVN